MVSKLCSETKALIPFYKNETELSYRKIAAHCGISESIVYKIWKTKLHPEIAVIKNRMIKFVEGDIFAKDMKYYYCGQLRL